MNEFMWVLLCTLACVFINVLALLTSTLIRCQGRSLPQRISLVVRLLRADAAGRSGCHPEGRAVPIRFREHGELLRRDAKAVAFVDAPCTHAL
jgi:hypothetical protein